MHLPRTPLEMLECCGCLLGLLGAFLVASNVEASRYGWLAFLAANLAMIAFARGARANWLLLQQIGFMASSCLGLYRTFF